MHSNLLPLLGISIPKEFSSIAQLLPIHINLGVLILEIVVSQKKNIQLILLCYQWIEAIEVQIRGNKLICVMFSADL